MQLMSQEDHYIIGDGGRIAMVMVYPVFMARQGAGGDTRQGPFTPELKSCLQNAVHCSSIERLADHEAKYTHSSQPGALISGPFTLFTNAFVYNTSKPGGGRDLRRHVTWFMQDHRNRAPPSTMAPE